MWRKMLHLTHPNRSRKPLQPLKKGKRNRWQRNPTASRLKFLNHSRRMNLSTWINMEELLQQTLQSQYEAGQSFTKTLFTNDKSWH
nr:MAG TPA: hypothetical protein [Caudoviricetes sp.]